MTSYQTKNFWENVSLLPLHHRKSVLCPKFCEAMVYYQPQPVRLLMRQRIKRGMMYESI